MMKVLISVALATAALSAHALDIVDALNRGQQVQLSQCESVAEDAPEVAVLRDSFSKLQDARHADTPVTLVVAKCSFGIQVLGGKVIVHPAVAHWNEGERLFVLAHELGHIEHGDWHSFTHVHQEAIPADMSDEQVGLTMRRMAPKMRELMYGFEYNADEYALELLSKMGRDALAEGREAIARVPTPSGSPTHPGTAQRIARLTLALR